MHRCFLVPFYLTGLLVSASLAAAEPLIALDEAGLAVRLEQEGALAWLDIGRTAEQGDPIELSVSRVFNPDRLIIDVSHAHRGQVRMMELQHPAFSTLKLFPFKNALRLELGLKQQKELRIARQRVPERSAARLLFELDAESFAGRLAAERLSAGFRSAHGHALAGRVRTARRKLNTAAAASSSSADMNWNTAKEYLEKEKEISYADLRGFDGLLVGEASDPVDRLTFGYGSSPAQRTVFEGAAEDEGIDLSVRPGWFDGTYLSLRRLVKHHPAAVALVSTMLFLLSAVFFIVYLRIRSLPSHRRKRKRKTRATASFAESWNGTDSVKRQKEELAYCYSVLGVAENATDEAIRNRYKHLIKAFHTDKLEAHTLPEEIRELANKQFQKVQSAYQTLKQQRGF